MALLALKVDVDTWRGTREGVPRLVELFRRGKMASAGGATRTFAAELKRAGAPSWLVRTFEKVGYPFAQPAGWIWALWHRTPAAAFEAVVGDVILDRDPQYFQLGIAIYNFDIAKRHHYLDGLQLLTERGPTEVTGSPARFRRKWPRGASSPVESAVLPYKPAAQWLRNRRYP